MTLETERKKKSKGVLVQGIIDRIQREESEGLIAAEDGSTFSFRAESLVDMDFDSIVVGTEVEYDVDEASGGTPRAINIRPAAEQLSMAAVRALSPEEHVEPDEDARASQVPPGEIEKDTVDEQSWESFPASDAPSSGKFT